MQVLGLKHALVSLAVIAKHRSAGFLNFSKDQGLPQRRKLAPMGNRASSRRVMLLNKTAWQSTPVHSLQGGRSAALALFA